MFKHNASFYDAHYELLVETRLSGMHCYEFLCETHSNTFFLSSEHARLLCTLVREGTTWAGERVPHSRHYRVAMSVVERAHTSRRPEINGDVRNVLAARMSLNRIRRLPHNRQNTGRQLVGAICKG